MAIATLRHAVRDNYYNEPVEAQIAHTMKKHIISALLLIVAVLFYALGAAGPATVFLVLGAVAELSFWYRLFGPKKE